MSKIRQILRRLLLLGMFTAIAACSTHLPPIFGTTPGGYSPVEYYGWLKTANSLELVAERQRLEAKLQENQEQFRESVQLALLLTVAEPSSPEDENRALELLDATNNNTEKTRNNRSYRQFSALWENVLLDRQQQRSLQNQALRELREKKQELEEQIRALTSIEQQLMEREQRQDSQNAH